MKEYKYDISIVIPCFENIISFKKSFSSALNQRYKAKQILLIDSSKTQNIKNFIKNFNLKNKHLDIIYYHQNNLYPGKARNIGASKSKYNWIAFLDSKTVAKKNWLFDYCELIEKNNYDVIFGSTKFIANNNISKLFLYATYGNKSHCTVPGTLIKKKYFERNKFLENLRSGEDVLWRKEIINNNLINKLILEKNYYISYDQISNKFSENIYKHFIYSIHSSTISIKNNIKDIYLSFFLILTALVVPKWNVLIGGWDANPLYVPNITKLYILSLVLILIVYLFFKNILNSFKLLRETYLIKIIIFILFIFFSIFVIRWNEEYSLRYYDTIFKFPHITKIYLFSIILISIIYRGVFVPLTKNVKLRELGYIEWIKIGTIGLFIDIVKSPAFIFGSIVSILKLEFLFKHNQEKTKTKKMLIVCPFPYDVQAGQRLKYEQHLKYFYLNGYDIKLSPFISKKTWKIIYKKGNFIKKILALLKGYFIRILTLFTIRQYDLIYIFMWVVPYTSSYVEFLYRKIAKNIIYDMEDNILIISQNEINPITSSFKSVNKYKYLIETSDQIIVSSQYLQDICNNLNNNNSANYICASINLHRYKKINKIKKDYINIGWTGTFSTKKYLRIVEPIIKRVSKLRNIRFVVIGDFKYNLNEVHVENIIWNKSNEINDLNKIDIGVYPLFEDEWVLGKSGLKALQYMALGIPTVATNYGNIKNIIKNKHNGYLVNNEDEWVNILIQLCDDIDLRNYIGNNGYLDVKKFYSVEATSNKYLNVINKLK